MSTEIPQEVFDTVTYQLPDLKIHNVLIVANETLTNPKFNVPITTIKSDLLPKEASESVELMIINRLAKADNVNEILKQTARILKPDGVAVFYEDKNNIKPMDVADLSSLFDSFADQDLGVSFKLLCMNQTFVSFFESY